MLGLGSPAERLVWRILAREGFWLQACYTGARAGKSSGFAMRHNLWRFNGRYLADMPFFRVGGVSPVKKSHEMRQLHPYTA